MRGEVEAASSAATYYLRHQHRLTNCAPCEGSHRFKRIQHW